MREERQREPRRLVGGEAREPAARAAQRPERTGVEGGGQLLDDLQE